MSAPGEESAPEEEGAAETMTLAVGESGTAYDIEVRFDQVLEDSRCPEGVNCVWEGNGKIQVTMSGEAGEKSAELNTSVEPRSTSYDGYTLRLVKLDPYPREGQGGSEAASE